MAELGPEERELFESQAAPLYEETVAATAVSGSDDPRIADGGELRDALRPAGRRWTSWCTTDENATWVPVDPSTVQSHVVVADEPARRRAARRVVGVGARLRRPDPVLAALADSPSAGRSRSSTARGDRQLPRPAPSPRPRRSCSPPSRRPAASARACRRPLDRDTAALERGVTMRTLYQHSARRTRSPVSTSPQVSAHGARGAHPRRVLQPDDRDRPAARGDPRPGCRQRRDRRPGAGPRRLPRRRLRARLGAGPPVHQHRALDDERHRSASSAR